MAGASNKYFVAGTKHGQEGCSQILAVSPFLTLLGLEAGCCEREEEFFADSGMAEAVEADAW